MPTVRIVTDSTCDLPAALAQEQQIAVVPATVLVDGRAFRDGVDITTDAVLRAVPAGGDRPAPATLPPASEAFEQVFRRLQRERADGIVAVLASTHLSGAYRAALAARDAHALRTFPIAVLDSQSISMGLGLIVLEAARAAAGGAAWNEVVTTVQRAVPQTHVAFLVESLEPLLRSGRAPRLIPTAETMPALKPLLRLDTGRVVPFERTRTRYKALEALYAFIEDFPHVERLALLHSTSGPEVEALANRLAAAGTLPRDQIAVLTYGPAIATVIGAGAIAAAVDEGAA